MQYPRDRPRIRPRHRRSEGGVSGPPKKRVAGMPGAAARAAYIREVLVNEIVPGPVVNLDNLKANLNKEAAQALRGHGCWVLYLDGQ